MVATNEIEKLIRELEKLKTSVTSRLRKIQSFHCKDHGWDVVGVARVLDAMSDQSVSQHDIDKALTTARESTSRDADTAFLELDADIRDFCEHRDWRLDGQWPRLHVERAIEIRVDDKKRTITIAGIKLSGCSVSAIEDAVAEVVAGLLPKSFDREVFIDQMSRSFDECGARTGGPVRVYDIYKQLLLLSQNPTFWRNASSRHFSELTLDQFRARLSDTLDAGIPDRHGREMRLFPPLNPQDGIFVYQPAERRFGLVGSIEFLSADSARR